MHRYWRFRGQFPAPVHIHVIELRIGRQHRFRSQSCIHKDRSRRLVGSNAEQHLRIQAAIDMTQPRANRKRDLIEHHAVRISVRRRVDLRRERKRALTARAVDCAHGVKIVRAARQSSSRRVDDRRQAQQRRRQRPDCRKASRTRRSDRPPRSHHCRSLQPPRCPTATGRSHRSTVPATGADRYASRPVWRPSPPVIPVGASEYQSSS